MDMAILTIDTHNFITRLIQAGMVEKQAEAIVDGLKEMDLKNVATKEDVRLAIAELKADIFKWLIPILLGQIGAFALVVEFILRR